MSYNINQLLTGPFNYDTKTTVDPYQIGQAMTHVTGQLQNTHLLTGPEYIQSPPIYRDQTNEFTVKDIRDCFKLADAEAYFPSVFPLKQIFQSKKSYTWLELNPFAAQEAPPGTPTLFTTTTFESWYQEYKWTGVGFSLPLNFMTNPYGAFLYDYYIRACAASIVVAGMADVFRSLNGMADPYALRLSTRNTDPEQLFLLLNQRRIDRFNCVRDVGWAFLEKLSGSIDDEERIAEIVSTDVYLAPNSVNTYLRYLEDFSQNNKTGHMGNKEGNYNKVETLGSVNRIGSSRFYKQPPLKLGVNAIWKPLNSVATIGEHYVMPNAIPENPYSEKAKHMRSIEIYDATKDKMERITFKKAFEHAWDLKHSDKKLDRTTNLHEFLSAKSTDVWESSIKSLHNYFLQQTGKKLVDETREYPKGFSAQVNPTASVDGYLGQVAGRINDVKGGLVPLSKDAHFTKHYLAEKGNTTEVFIKYMDDVFTLYADFFNHTTIKFDKGTMTLTGDSKSRAQAYIYAACNVGQPFACFKDSPTLIPWSDKMSGEWTKCFVSGFALPKHARDFPASNILHIIERMYYFASSDKASIEKLISGGISVHFNILLQRLNMTYDAGSIYRVKSGGGTCMRVEGWHQATVSTNTNAFCFDTTYRQLLGTEFTNSYCFSRVKDANLDTYLGGEDTRFMKTEAIRKVFAYDRDEYVDKMDDWGGSIIALFIDSHENYHQPLFYTAEDDFGAASNLAGQIAKNNKIDLQDLSLDHYMKRIAEMIPIDFAKKKFFPNHVSNPGPRREPNADGVWKDYNGSSCWKYAGDNCRDKRYGKVDHNSRILY